MADDMARSAYVVRARQKWPSAVWIVGDGPYASVSKCHDYPDARPGDEDSYTTVMLFATIAEAEAAKADIDRMGCGGGCTRYHLIARIIPGTQSPDPVTRPKGAAYEDTYEYRHPLPHYLYRYFDACGCLLYVGITDEPARRDREHGRSSPWHQLAVRREVAEMASRSDAEQAERDAVRDESPAFNSALRDAPTTNGLLTKYLLAHSGQRREVTA